MNLTHISKKICIRVSKLLSVISSQNSWSSSSEILSWTDNEPPAAEPPFLRTKTSYSSVANSLESFIPAKQSKAKQHPYLELQVVASKLDLRERKSLDISRRA